MLGFVSVDDHPRPSSGHKLRYLNRDPRLGHRLLGSGPTHSNIYRRLCRREPAITIGHYRKSMLVHPTQNRGLSLREASRLQSFPDWFRFAGAADGGGVGLVHKQQQLANAVCPLVTKAIAEYLFFL